MASVQILEKQILDGTKYPLEMIRFQKPDMKGKMHDDEAEVYYRPDAVGVLLVDKHKKKLLFTRQFRLPTFLNGNDTGYLNEVCAGLIDETETPEQTAKREAKEETGYEISSLEKIAGVYSSAGGITEFLHLYVALYDSTAKHEQGGGLAAESEAIELVEMSFDDAKEKLRLSEFKDAKTVILLQHIFMV